MAFNTQAKSTCWSITINNPTSDDEDAIQEARLKGWKVEGQKEKGELGTEHYQLMLKTPQVRGSAIKKQFPRAHIEIAKNVKALSQYVHKDDTRIATLENDDKYPSPTKFMGLFADYVSTEYKAIIRKYDVAYYDMDSEQLLEVFDDCIRKLIGDGYYVEAYGVNPQVRGSVKRYGQEIIYREIAKKSIQENASSTQASNEDDEDGSQELEVEGS